MKPDLHLNVSWQDLLRPDWAGINSAAINRFTTWDPALSETIRLAASSSLIGQGAEVADASHALKLLGSARVRHIALWHRMRELFDRDSDGAAECVTLAAAAFVIAREEGLPPYGAVTAGLATRLGQRLLLPEAGDHAVLSALLEQLKPVERSKLEVRLFGTTAQAELEVVTGAWSLPRDLRELLYLPPFSPARRIADSALTLLNSEEPHELFTQIPKVAKALAVILQVRGVPWQKPAAPEPAQLLMMVAGMKQETREAYKRVAEKEHQNVLFQDLLDDHDELIDSEGPRPSQMALHLDNALQNALRHDRPFSVLGIRLGSPSGAPDARVFSSETVQMLRRATRAVHHVGHIDTRTLVIMLPETDLSGAHRFGTRLHQRLTSDDLQPKLFMTSLDQESDPTTSHLIRTIRSGLDTMETTPEQGDLRANEAPQARQRTPLYPRRASANESC